MVTINSSDDELIEIREGLDFVTEQSPPTGSTASSVPAYAVQCPEDHVLAVKAGTPLYPEIYDSNGDKVSARLIVTKADRQKNVITSEHAFEASLDRFDYSKQQVDKDYEQTLNKSIVLDQHEHLLVLVLVEDGDNAMDTSTSSLTIGDSANASGQPVYLRETDDLDSQSAQAVQQNSSNTGGN